jgi:cytochrome c oxidase subunit III
VATGLLSPPPSPAAEEVPYADDGNGIGGGRFDEPYYDPEDHSGPNSARSAASLGMYRAAMLIGTIWILTLFVTLSIVLESTRAHSKHWNPISFPRLLYVNTAFLLLSGVTIEFARFSRRPKASRLCVRFLVATLLLGLAFLGGQIVVWQGLGSRGIHLNSGGASFFFYLITATHALTVLGGIIALFSVIVVVRRLRPTSERQTTISIVAPYWHFVSGLWLYVLALLVSAQG